MLRMEAFERTHWFTPRYVFTSWRTHAKPIHHRIRFADCRVFFYGKRGKTLLGGKIVALASMHEMARALPQVLELVNPSKDGGEGDDRGDGEKGHREGRIPLGVHRYIASIVCPRQSGWSLNNSFRCQSIPTV